MASQVQLWMIITDFYREVARVHSVPKGEKAILDFDLIKHVIPLPYSLPSSNPKATSPTTLSFRLLHHHLLLYLQKAIPSPQQKTASSPFSHYSTSTRSPAYPVAHLPLQPLLLLEPIFFLLHYQPIHASYYSHDDPASSHSHHRRRHYSRQAHTTACESWQPAESASACRDVFATAAARYRETRGTTGGRGARGSCPRSFGG